MIVMYVQLGAIICTALVFKFVKDHVFLICILILGNNVKFYHIQLAARIAVSNLHKNTKKSFSES